jgi:hypothetical protein
MVFAPGGLASMNDLAREFLGRDLSVGAYRKDLKRGAGEKVVGEWPHFAKPVIPLPTQLRS